MASASPVAGVVVSAAAAAMDRAVSAAQYGRHDDVWAAINNRLAIVDELLRRGVDVDGHGGVLDETAMQWATRHGHVGVVCRLEAGGDADAPGNEGGAAVHLACRYQQVRVLCYLLARDVSSTAAASGLLEALDARRTPLMVAAEWFWSNPAR
ncbi:protein-cysteine S-palmitoyltransferase [Aureococcus anophagefferens]|nr:protein-cysteine S-palmitoyltransferase [Aureococcus anophagefferens]